jgi:hypothetical protein
MHEEGEALLQRLDRALSVLGEQRTVSYIIMGHEHFKNWWAYLSTQSRQVNLEESPSKHPTHPTFGGIDIIVDPQYPKRLVICYPPDYLMVE